jgi:Flp pilus assembly protein TadG
MRLAPQRPLRPAATIVESAFVIGIFLLFLFGLIEYGRLLMTKQIMENAAREGARWAVVHTYDGTTAQVQDQVDAYLSVARQQMTGYVKTTNISVYAADSSGNIIAGKAWTDCKFGENIAVSVTGNYHAFLPNLLLMKSDIGVSAKSVMGSEAN